MAGEQDETFGFTGPVADQILRWIDFAAEKKLYELLRRQRRPVSTAPDPIILGKTYDAIDRDATGDVTIWRRKDDGTEEATTQKIPCYNRGAKIKANVFVLVEAVNLRWEITRVIPGVCNDLGDPSALPGFVTGVDQFLYKNSDDCWALKTPNICGGG